MNPTSKVDVLIIYLKSIVLIYCTFLYADSENFLPTIVFGIFFILLYISLSILQCIFKRNKIQFFLKTLSLILIILCCILLSKYFALLLPVNITDIFGAEVEKSYIDIAILLFSFIVYKNIHDAFYVYFLIVFISIVYFRIMYYSFHRIVMLTKENDELKEKNYGLKSSMERKREFEEQMMYTSRLEERNKISQEMHDKLGHGISSSMLQLEASKMLIGKDNDKACSMIQSSIENLREGMNDIRNTLKNTKPAANELGINKIKLLISKFESSSGISVNLLYSGILERIDYGMWNIIYENASEALTNILKYSKANKAALNIEVLNKVVKFEIKDNGIGALNIVKGLGLSGMEERTQNAGGKIIVDGGDGFSVITLLPL